MLAVFSLLTNSILAHVKRTHQTLSPGTMQIRIPIQVPCGCTHDYILASHAAAVIVQLAAGCLFTAAITLTVALEMLFQQAWPAAPQPGNNASLHESGGCMLWICNRILTVMSCERGTTASLNRVKGLWEVTHWRNVCPLLG